MKTLIITGASQGIGKATAQLFQEKNWRIINISRQVCPLSEVINFAIDLSQTDWKLQYQDELLTAIKAADKICLIHNAAKYHSDAIDNLPGEILRAVLEVGVVAPALLNQLFLPHMSAGSSILYIGSTLSTKAVPYAASYVISKHAIAGLMRATCQDLAGTGVHTACICPGFTATEMLQQHLASDPILLKTITEQVCAKRLVEPREIAELALFCAEHPVVNGALIHANLGQIER